MEYIKLIKLMYLVDRAALNERGWPISTDVYVSMAHGPVLSRTYDLIREHSVNQSGRAISAERGRTGPRAPDD